MVSGIRGVLFLGILEAGLLSSVGAGAQEALPPPPLPVAPPLAAPAPEGATAPRAPAPPSSPAELDRADLDAVLARLVRRGFTQEEIDQARRDWQRHGRGDVEQVERLATFRLLGLPPFELEAFLADKRGVTRYYNERIGGASLRTAGWGLEGAGLALLALSAVLYAFEGNCDHDYQDLSRDSGCSTSLSVLGLISGLSGGALAVSGVPLILLGTERTDRWAPAGLLDVGSKDELAPYVLGRGAAAALEPDRARQAPLTLSLTPLALPQQGGGLSLTLGF